MHGFDVAAGQPSGDVSRLWNTCTWPSKSWTRDTDGGGVTVMLEPTPYEWVSSPWGTLPKVKDYVWVNEERREMRGRLRRNDTKCELVVRKEWHPDERGEQVSCRLVVEVKWS